MEANDLQTLGDLAIGEPAQIVEIVGQGADNQPGRVDGAELERRLLEMGFLEGEEVEILHEGPVGRDPIAVRLGGMIIAIRRFEARAVIVKVE